jgi:MFS family permease
MKEKSGFAAYSATTVLVGLGFFTMGLMDLLYDTFVPVFLHDYRDSKTLIGSIMTLDNLSALLLIPVFSSLSDRTRTRIGRRMPYIIVTLPLSALFFASIPFSAARAFWALIVVLFLLNMAKQAARGPVVALMPDTIPGEYRSEANGVINAMGGIAAIVAAVGLGPLIEVSIQLPVIGDTRRKLPFLIAGLLVVIATLLLFLFVKERNTRENGEKKEPLLKSLRLVFGSRDRSAMWILIAILLWFLGYQGVLPFLSLYSVQVLGSPERLVSIPAGVFAVAYTAFAIPSGIIAHKVGRKKTIRVALVVAATVTLLMFFHQPLAVALGLSTWARLVSFWVMLFVFGTFWVAVITNSFPMLWQMATYSNMGIYTGLYYLFSQLAAILAPPLTGALIDLGGYRTLFPYAAVTLLAAFVIMGLVSGGEPKTAGETSVEA